MNNKFIMIIIALVVAIILQFINVGFFFSSIFSNTPILEDILTLLDISAIIKISHEGVTINNILIFFSRFFSLCATVFTFVKLHEIGIIPSMDESEGRIISMIAAVIIHMGYNFILSELYMKIIEIIVQMTEHTKDQLENIINVF